MEYLGAVILFVSLVAGMQRLAVYNLYEPMTSKPWTRWERFQFKWFPWFRWAQIENDYNNRHGEFLNVWVER